MAHPLLDIELKSLANYEERVAYLLVAMGSQLGTVDFDGLYQESFTDGEDDKRVDFFYLDTSTGIAWIVQAYHSVDWGKTNPKDSKAAELSNAVDWMLEREIADLPTTIQGATHELRDTLDDGGVIEVRVVFVHNLSSSVDVDDELETVRSGVETALSEYRGPFDLPVRSSRMQISVDDVETALSTRGVDIPIRDTLTLNSTFTPQEEKGTHWRAAILSVDANELVALSLKYGDLLISANLGDYLGSRRSARNVNQRIEQAALTQSDDFWVFNNGVTVLTAGYEIKKSSVELQGVAVINGAQTIGSLTSAAQNSSWDPDSGSPRVMVRVVAASEDPSFIEEIVRNNNTQNPIHAWETRVNDATQVRLKGEFRSRYDITYHLRRGSTRRGPEDVAYDRLGPRLSAFYGDPYTAHRNCAALFDDETLYRALFNDGTNIRNILFVYRIGQTVTAIRDDLREKIKSATDSVSSDEMVLYSYFAYGAFALDVIDMCASVLDLFIAEQVPDYKVRVTLPDDVIRVQSTAVGSLRPLVGLILPPLQQLLANEGEDAYRALRTRSSVERLTASVRTQVEMYRNTNQAGFNATLPGLELVS